MERIEQHPDEPHPDSCIHCMRPLATVATRADSVPTTTLLTTPPRPLPVTTICRDCGDSFSKDEPYLVAFLSCVLAASTEPEDQPNASAARALKRSPALRADIDASLVEFPTPNGVRLAWIPDQVRVDRIVLKNARGHAYFECGEAMLGPPSSAWARPLTSFSKAERTAFEQLEVDRHPGAGREVPSRTISRPAPAMDLSDGWIVVEEGNYRYSVDIADGTRVRTVIAEYLATEVHWHGDAIPPPEESRSTPLLKKLSQLTAAVERGRSRTTCLRLWSAFIRERDDNRCVSCGSTGRLSAHHICRKSFLAAAQYLPGNGITLCRDCHRKAHDGFNRKPDLSQPVDAQGGEKLALMERLYSLLLSDALCRGMLDDQFYFLSDEVLGFFRRMQGYPDLNPSPGSRLEQAYLILAEPERPMVNAILEANGLPAGGGPLLPGGFIAGFIRPGESPETIVVRSYRPRSE